jgi:outer membrane protein TolC
LRAIAFLAIPFLILAIAPAHAITLDQTLDQTLQNNPAIQQAKLNLEQAAGRRLVLNSITWPNIKVGVPAGIQGGHRGGESTKAFIFARGTFTQPLLNIAIPPSRRLGDVQVLIAMQQLNIAVVEQVHTARLAFYSALYNQRLQSVRAQERQRFDQNAASQKDRYEAGLADRSAFTSATVQARDLDAQIETARRAYGQAQLQLTLALGLPAGPDAKLPEPEGELESHTFDPNLTEETHAAIERRADIKLARLMVRAANEQQRIIEAGYFPIVNGIVLSDLVPTSTSGGIHREGSTRRTDDVLGSEAREGAVYTWRVIDNGRVIGADIKQRRTREINEIACRRLESNVGAELSRIRNNLEAINARQHSLAGGSLMAQQNAEAIQQNLAGGIVSELDYRLAQNASLDLQSGLLTAAYQYNVAMAEWDRATGRYFQFSDEPSLGGVRRPSLPQGETDASPVRQSDGLVP